MSVGQGTGLGEQLRRARTDADLTLEALAHLSGVSDRTISDIERGASLGPQRRTVELLVDALDLDDGRREAILAAARAGRHRQPAGADLRAPLPRAMTDFTGRDDEIELITAHLASGPDSGTSPVTVVCGPPGFGKTTLAVRIAAGAAAFDSTHFVDLRGYDAQPLGAHQVLTRLIHAVTGQSGPVPRRVGDAADLWQTVLADRRILVVLDNAAAEEQVRWAFPAAGPSAVIITSRGALGGLEDVKRVFLDELSPSDAVALLRKVAPGPQHEDQDLERLAALCDHIPLALRIAGNRLASRRSWTAHDLAVRLAGEERRIDTLRAGDLEIRSVIALSYDRLTPRGRETFRRLAHLRGSTFDAPLAARAGACNLTTAEDTLDELMDVGLVQPAAQGRYRFHDLLRIYAGDRLRAEEPSQDRADRDADLRRWLLRTTIDAGRWYEPGYESAPAVADPLVDLSTIELAELWLRAEVDHWFVALQDAAAADEHQLVVDVAESLHWFSDLWAHWGSWYDVYALGTEAARRLGDDEVLATQLGYVAWAELYTRSDPEAGLAAALEARAVAHRAGSLVQEGWATYYAGWAQIYLERFDESLAHAQESKELMAAAGDPDGTLQAWRLVGNVLRVAGRPAEALAHDQAAVAWMRDPASGLSQQVVRFTAAASYAEQAHTRADLEQWTESISAADEALLLLDQQDNPRIRATAHTARGRALTGLGRTEEARADLESALELAEILSDPARLERVQALLAVLDDAAI